MVRLSNNKQEELILDLFVKNPDAYFTSEDVYGSLPFNVNNIPLTSIRRAMTNLATAKKIEKTDKTKLSSLGRNIRCYRLRQNRYQEFHWILGESWGEALGPIMESKYMSNLYEGLKKKRVTQIIHPTNTHDIFTAFRYTPVEKVKVVILGSNPYCTHDVDPDVAEGIAFSSGNKGVQPRTLHNILSAVEESYGGLNLELMTNYSLHGWAHQGVLLLNQALTAPHGKPDAHIKSWEPFLHAVFDVLIKQKHIVWMIWNEDSRKYIPTIHRKTDSKHPVIAAEDPAAPTDRGMLSSWEYEDCFKRCDYMLEAEDVDLIDWTSPEPLPF